jgi:mRNA-degrading endonuclease HigB of HigAB toxin-antitoxin module
VLIFNQPGQVDYRLKRGNIPMTDNEKIIDTINRYLKKLDVKQLRLILQVAYQFVKVLPGS